MPVVKIVFKYPEKFLGKVIYFSYLTNLASKKGSIMKENPDSFESRLLRKIFFVLGRLSFWTFIVTNGLCKKIFKIDFIEEALKD